VCVCVPALTFPPRAQAAVKKHGIACGAAANSRSAEEHLDAQFALVPSSWVAKGGHSGTCKAKKPDLLKPR
jgi:hypothetical protein